MEREILLQNTAKGIVAHNLVNGQPDPAIVRLFGTHILPTAYRSGDALTIQETISQLNPGVLVGWI